MPTTPLLLLAKLVLAHLLVDFALQPSSWVASKEAHKWRSRWFWAHVLLHGLAASLLLGIVRYWWLGLAVVAVHGAIDLLKLYRQKAHNRASWFFIDQGLHALSLVGLWWIAATPARIEWMAMWNRPAVWIYASGLLTVTVVSGRVLQVLLSKWERLLPPQKEEQLPNAGLYIGMLERLFIFLFILLNELEAIGFLLAAKSVFRFGDLSNSKNRNFTEYILIGTLVSFALAMGTAFAVRALV